MLFEYVNVFLIFFNLLSLHIYGIKYVAIFLIIFKYHALSNNESPVLIYINKFITIKIHLQDKTSITQSHGVQYQKLNKTSVMHLQELLIVK